MHTLSNTIMAYTICLTETYVAYVSFETRQEAEEWLEEPDYDYVSKWELVDADREIVTTQN